MAKTPKTAAAEKPAKLSAPQQRAFQKVGLDPGQANSWDITTIIQVITGFLELLRRRRGGQ